MEAVIFKIWMDVRGPGLCECNKHCNEKCRCTEWMHAMQLLGGEGAGRTGYYREQAPAIVGLLELQLRAVFGLLASFGPA